MAVQLKSKTDGKIYVPISTLGVGSQKDNTRNIAFDKNTDFVLEIDENGETRLLADSYYSTFHYIYGYSKGVFDFDNDYSVKIQVNMSVSKCLQVTKCICLMTIKQSNLNFMRVDY